MDFTQLETFIVLCETENITHAAEILFKTQPTVSSRIQLLEEELGFRLINRSKGKKNISITPKGQIFLEHAKTLLNLYREVTEETNLLSNSLTISSVSSLKVPVITDICKKMRNAENTRISLLTYQTDDAYKMIANKKLDVAFVSVEKNINGVICEPAFQQDFYVVSYCPTPSPIKCISSESLDPKKEIYWSWGSSFDLWHKSKFGLGNYPIHVDSFAVIKEFLVDSNYWTILQKQNLTELQKYIPLQIYQLIDPPPPRVAYMLTSLYPDKNNLKTLKKFKQYVSEYSKENQLI